MNAIERQELLLNYLPDIREEVEIQELMLMEQIFNDAEMSIYMGDYEDEMD